VLTKLGRPAGTRKKWLWRPAKPQAAMIQGHPGNKLVLKPFNRYRSIWKRRWHGSVTSSTPRPWKFLSRRT